MFCPLVILALSRFGRGSFRPLVFSKHYLTSITQKAKRTYTCIYILLGADVGVLWSYMVEETRGPGKTNDLRRVTTTLPHADSQIRSRFAAVASECFSHCTIQIFQPRNLLQNQWNAFLETWYVGLGTRGLSWFACMPCKYAYMGPIWAVSGQAHMGMPILAPYGTNVGNLGIWANPEVS